MEIPRIELVVQRTGAEDSNQVAGEESDSDVLSVQVVEPSASCESKVLEKVSEGWCPLEEEEDEQQR